MGSTSYSRVDQDFLYCKEDFCCPSPLGVWTKFYKSDPRIALGKYSPLEKEIQHLGGVHTRAARRLLVIKHTEERKMLRDLDSVSPDDEAKTKYKMKPFLSCPVCGPPEKIWTAKVVVPVEDFQMPPREKTNISKHIERMQQARSLKNKEFLPCLKKAKSSVPPSDSDLRPTGRVEAEEGDNQGGPDLDKAKQEEAEEEESKDKDVKRIKMKVIFKSEEPKKCLVCHHNDRKPFLLDRKRQRAIAGFTNRNLFPIAEFPGDLLLMNQDFLSRGLHPCNAIKTYWLQDNSVPYLY